MPCATPQYNLRSATLARCATGHDRPESVVTIAGIRTKHLDTSNESLVRSVLMLRQNWKTEEEVRLVFDRMQNDVWSDEHASLQPSNSAATRLSLPFDWSQAGVKLYKGPSLDEKQFTQIRKSLHRSR